MKNQVPENPKMIHRREFFRRFFGRSLTLGIAAAETLKMQNFLNRLLKAKDRLNKGRRR